MTMQPVKHWVSLTSLLAISAEEQCVELAC